MDGKQKKKKTWDFHLQFYVYSCCLNLFLFVSFSFSLSLFSISCFFFLLKVLRQKIAVYFFVPSLIHFVFSISIILLFNNNLVFFLFFKSYILNSSYVFLSLIILFSLCCIFSLIFAKNGQFRIFKTVFHILIFFVFCYFSFEKFLLCPAQHFYAILFSVCFKLNWEEKYF